MNPTVQLLLDAAKAIGITDADFHGPIEGIWSNELDEYWNPLEDDGDALRLAAKLRFDVLTNCFGAVCIEFDDIIITEKLASDEYGDVLNATRLVIVKAAAEIGKKLNDV